MGRGSLRSPLTFVRYAAGHQIYLDPMARQQLHADVAAFVTGRER